ncbi:ester cyclase [Agarilytica rhodophyticola]|uniref:nuclear transport factor 2 family protein n=1 Tax=Agarilytica rhodophyticola TaxID=1737490 RepID=UPI000B342CD8|nr:ester cyclase [Agarilytica rhodophyticola]
MSRMLGHFDSAPKTHSENTNMQGFDPEFADIVDYILRITYRIWEGKQVGLCRDYYSEECPVYTLAGMTVGCEQVTQNTINTLGAFPDRTLAAVNIIWGGDDKEGYHTSHLIDTEMTNLGDSEFGPASGEHGRIFVIAHCIIKANKVVEEWLVRDNFSLAEQLGFDPIEVAKESARQPLEERFVHWMASEKNRVKQHVNNQRKKLDASQEQKETLLASLHNIWNCQMIGDVQQLYTQGAKIFAPASTEIAGFDAIMDFYIALQASLSDLKVSFDYICSTSDKDNGEKIAVRWTMVGNHTGNRLFGKPSGKEILIIGESQYHMVDGKIQQEWTVYDQLAVYSQIFRNYA